MIVAFRSGGGNRIRLIFSFDPFSPTHPGGRPDTGGPDTGG